MGKKRVSVKDAAADSDIRSGRNVRTGKGGTATGGAAMWSARIAGIWMGFVLAVLPLLLNDGYYDILDFKYGAFGVTAAVMAAILLIVNIKRIPALISGAFRADPPAAKAKEAGAKAGTDAKAKGAGANAGKADAKAAAGPAARIRAFWRRLSLTDKGVLIFFIISAISTLQASPYVSQAFYGNEGRYNGLVLNTLYTLFYFLLSRNLRCKPRYMRIFMASGLLVCLIGITDYFRMDILGIDASTTFYSTIGNINSFTAFAGMVVAVSGGLYVFSECSIYVRISYLIIHALSLEAMFMGNSDNTYLFLGLMYVLLPISAFRGRRSTYRFCALVSTFFTCILAVLLVDRYYTGETVGIDSVIKLIGRSNIIEFAAAASWALTAAVYYLVGRPGRPGGVQAAGKAAAGAQPSSGKAAGDVQAAQQADHSSSAGVQAASLPADDAMPRTLVRVWIAFIGICIIAVTALFIWSNSNPELVEEKYPQLVKYLVFNDAWGTHRGYIWRAAFEEYACLAPIHQIFGTGPDTFGIYMVKLRYNDMVRITGYYFDSAHNEYIELFFTLGPIGLAAHMMILIGTVKRCFINLAGKVCRHKADMAAAALAVAGYAAQAIVNINVPIVAMFFWAMVTLGESMARDTAPEG